MSTDQQPNEPGPTEGKGEPDQPPVTDIDVPEPKGIRLSDLAREPATEEERAKRAEELRRLGLIAKGMHPDTSKPLQRGDEKTFRSATEKMQAQTYWLGREADRLNPISAHMRAMAEAQS